jgi:hypothetical protein
VRTPVLVTGADLSVSDRGCPSGTLACGTYVARAGVLPAVPSRSGRGARVADFLGAV